MTILTRKEIELRLMADLADRLVVTPLLHSDQIGHASIDVRLSNEFLLPTKAVVANFDYTDEPSQYRKVFGKARREFGEALYVHPGQLVLGATFEFIRMPATLAGYVIGRSSLGRTGLVIATATAVAPGYSGCITLEIVNEGEVPLPIFPGMRIAHIVLHKTEGSAEYDGRFSCSVGPQPPLLSRDPEMILWRTRNQDRRSGAV